VDATHHYGSPFVARGTFSTDPANVKTRTTLLGKQPFHIKPLVADDAYTGNREG